MRKIIVNSIKEKLLPVNGTNFPLQRFRCVLESMGNFPQKATSTDAIEFITKYNWDNVPDTMLVKIFERTVQRFYTQM